MKKSVLITLIVTISFPFSLLLADSDWQYWYNYKASLDLKDNLVISVAPEFRCKDYLDNYYTHIETGLDWKIRKWISLSTKYRHIITRKGDDCEQEYHPYIDIKFMPSFFKLNLSNRSRMEWRIKDNDDSFRYRNQTSIKLPIITLLPIYPYFAEEFFYDFQVDKINKNRIYAGVEFPLGQKFGALASYILESNIVNNSWLGINILKLEFKYNIN